MKVFLLALALVTGYLLWAFANSSLARYDDCPRGSVSAAGMAQCK